MNFCRMSGMLSMYFQIVRGRNRDKVISMACKSLAVVMKDHDHPRAVGLAEVMRYILNFRSADALTLLQSDILNYFDISFLQQESAVKYINTIIPSSREAEWTWLPEFGKKPVRITITSTCPSILANRIRLSLSKLSKFTRLDWDMVDKG